MLMERKSSKGVVKMRGCNNYRRRLRCMPTNVYCRNSLIGRIQCGRFTAFEGSRCPCSE